MADKHMSSVFNEESFVYWLGLQSQQADLVVPDKLRIFRERDTSFFVLYLLLVTVSLS